MCLNAVVQKQFFRLNTICCVWMRLFVCLFAYACMSRFVTRALQEVLYFSFSHITLSHTGAWVFSSNIAAGFRYFFRLIFCIVHTLCLSVRWNCLFSDLFTLNEIFPSYTVAYTHTLTKRLIPCTHKNINFY